MGSRWSAIFFAQQNLDEDALVLTLQAAVDAVDRQMSTWKPKSDLNRLNAAPVGSWVPIPGELTQVLSKALEIGRASGGAYIGVGANAATAVTFDSNVRTYGPILTSEVSLSTTG